MTDDLLLHAEVYGAGLHIIYLHYLNVFVFVT